MFALRAVQMRYGSRIALAGLNLTVRAGERVAVIGSSGAGKSTLIGLLNGTVTPSAGTVEVLGTDLGAASVRARRAMQRRIGTIHQQFDLVGELRVVHNVNAGHLGDWPLRTALLSLLRPREADAARALDRVGLADRIGQRTSSLSGGEQQRVAIARVLVQRPEAVLADEPVASLDRARGAEVLDLLHDIAIESGTTLLASLHDVALATDRFERVLGLRAGRLVFDSPPGKLDRADVDALYALEPDPDPPDPLPAAPASRLRRGRC